MKRRLIIAAALPLLMQPTRVSHAVIVTCANCAMWTDQLVANAKQAAQYATQLQEKAVQDLQYANQITNTIRLPMTAWSQVQGDISTVRNLVNAASVLTGNSGTIMSRLSNAQGYATTAAMTPAQISAQFQQWSYTISNASNSFGRTVGLQQAQMNNYAALQAAANLHAQTATGQMQVLQANAELASLTSTQLNQMQATLTAAAQEQTTRDLIAADRQAAQDAQFQQFIAEPLPLPTGGPRY